MSDTGDLSRDELVTLAQRAQADLINYKRRVERELEGASERARVECLRAWLPFLDAWAEARAHHAEEQLYSSLDAQLGAVLEALDAEVSNPVGESFNPRAHEAIEVVEGERSGVVMRVTRLGYSVAGQLVRPASVIVSKSAERAEESAEDQSAESEA